MIQIDWDEEAAEKGGYETFMLKEINEQPDVAREHDRRARRATAGSSSSSG